MNNTGAFIFRTTISVARPAQTDSLPGAFPHPREVN